MEKEKTIEILNRFIEVNNDRFDAYTSASKEIEDPDLKLLFIRFAQTSQKFNQELSHEIYSSGSNPEEGSALSGKYSRKRLDIKSSIKGADRFVIYDSCEIIEEHIVDVYENILRNELLCLSIEQLTILRTQYSLIKNDLIRLKFIRILKREKNNIINFL